MKEFLVGLLFLILAGIAIAVGSLLWVFLIPLLIVMHIFLRFLIVVAILVFGVWLVGKIVVMIWESIKR